MIGTVLDLKKLTIGLNLLQALIGVRHSICMCDFAFRRQGTKETHKRSQTSKLFRMTLSLKSRIFTTTNKLLLISIPKNLLEPDPDLRRDVHHGRVQLQPQAAQKLHPRQRQKPLQFRPGKNSVIKCKKRRHVGKLHSTTVAYLLLAQQTQV